VSEARGNEISVRHRVPSRDAAILPGATIGILGGGQLGRMTAIAARTLGYDVRVLDPDRHAPAFAVAGESITAQFDDVRAGARLAEHSHVVTLEIEQVSTATIEAAAHHAPMRPSAGVVHTVQDRGRQKEFLAAQRFPLGDFAVVEDAAACAAAVARFGQSIVKSTMGGYDGRGQVRLRDANEAASAFAAVGGGRAVVEKFLSIEAELSVLVARSPSGEVVAFPPSRNHHENGILVWAVVPAEFDPAVEQRAREVAIAVATELGVQGLLAVEMFLTTSGDLLINELAPRPHNTYHHTERACPTSQFEQLVRAICNLPLGDITIVRPTAIHNVLGDLWSDGTPDFRAALAIPRARLHLYGKRAARPGRKMGHISACGVNATEALEVAVRAFGALGSGT
jgi:5-(carboxyamino)imidazole ribonucleotide synthase